MSREVEFRGKQLYGDNGWCFGFYSEVSALNLPYITKRGETKGHEIIPETRGQYTGLKDKNGNKIFEGDIVMLMGNKRPAEVVYGPTAFCLLWRGVIFSERRIVKDVYSPLAYPLQPYSISDMSGMYEVIGNVFDSPELLEGKNEA